MRHNCDLYGKWGFYHEDYLLTFCLLSQMNEKAVNAFIQQGLKINDDFLLAKTKDWLTEMGYTHKHWTELKSKTWPDVKTKMMEILAESLGVTDYLTDPVLPSEDYLEWIAKELNEHDGDYALFLTVYK